MLLVHTMVLTLSIMLFRLPLALWILISGLVGVEAFTTYFNWASVLMWIRAAYRLLQHGTCL